jgi:tetratricopeptide (TPR) repeat protein
MARNTSFVGRDEQLGELRASWRAAAAGRGGFVVVSGEAGIGKTRLVEQLVAEVTDSDRDVRVAWGSCAGLDAPPLWPWQGVLRDVPGGAGAADGYDAPATSDLVDLTGWEARAYARIVDRLRVAAAAGPLLVVLDDLHWADPDSLRLLRLAATEARRAPLLLVGTLRPDDGAAAPAVRATLSDLASSTEVVQLRGLPATAVGRLVSELTGQEPTEELVAAVTRQTGGNPFFLREVLRLLIAEGGLDEAVGGGDRLAVPPLVRDVLLRRAAQLSAPVRALLDAAAVAGARAPLPVLARVLDDDPGAVRRAADEAEAARFVTVAAQDLRFEHDLVREALVAELDGAERRRLHLAIGHALRDTDPAAATDRISEIAGHLVEALPAGDPIEAAAAALAAGRQALEQHAPTDAVRHLERGIAALDGAGPAAALLRTSLLLALGDARTVDGDRPGARHAYRDGAAGARAAADPESLSRAAIGFAGVMGSPRPDPERVALLEEALAALGDRRDSLRARLQARLAHALLFSGQRARRSALADEAVELARATGDDAALAAALYAWSIVHAMAGNYERRLAAADELLAVGRRCDVAEIEACAEHFHAHLMAEAGDFAAFDVDVAACEALARRLHDATWQWTSLVHRAMRATMQGRFADAEVLGDEAFGLGARSQHEVAAAVYYSHLLSLRAWQGRLDELLPAILDAAGRYTELPAVWAALPYAHAELGRRDEAADELRRAVEAHKLEDIPGAQSWPVALAMLARASAVTGNAKIAGRVRGLLAQLGERHVIGPFGDCYYGPALLYVGLCSATVGELDDAVGQFERALQQATAVGARPVVAWAKAELAAVLELSGGADAEQVAALRAEAAAELDRLGMPRHRAALGEVGEAAPPAEGPPNEFRRTAEGWSISYDGQAVVVGPTKGLADIHRLLAVPGVELHVLELAREAEVDVATGTGAAPGTAGASAEGAGGGSRQPVLDERAKVEYRRRLQDLQAEVDDARACADLARAEQAEAELDFLVTELAAGLGFGGRDRTMTDEAERARQAVRARIRYTLDRLERVHPALRRHLDRSLLTGTFCSYQPERPTSWVTA